MPHYLHYDVFTNRPFEGNQLAVFPDARGLPAERMQVITREMNFSESTFVLPAHRGSVVRRAVPPRAPRFARRGDGLLADVRARLRSTGGPGHR